MSDRRSSSTSCSSAPANTARSILAEGILRKVRRRASFHAFPPGSQPEAPTSIPYALEERKR